jgi:hypothetical protein
MRVRAGVCNKLKLSGPSRHCGGERARGCGVTRTRLTQSSRTPDESRIRYDDDDDDDYTHQLTASLRQV